MIAFFQAEDERGSGRVYYWLLTLINSDGDEASLTLGTATERFSELKAAVDELRKNQFKGYQLFESIPAPF